MQVTTPLLVPTKKTRWGSIGFFLAITLTTVIGLPIYVYHFGLRRDDVTLFLVFSFLTILAITSGYHRLYAHHAFKAHPAVQFVMLFFGAAAVQQSALKWSALHRQHHRFTDTEQDPYNITRGFFYAHMGWLLFWKQSFNYDCVQDLQKNRLVMHQHKHFQSWSVIAGLVLPILIGALYGSWLGGLLFGVGARLTVVYQATFFINSAAHSFGKANYDPQVSAKDNWICALLTNGEGYHNFHHRFSSDYRNGIKWYHWDPSKWLIWLLGRVGLTWDLQITPPDRILQEKLA